MVRAEVHFADSSTGMMDEAEGAVGSAGASVSAAALTNPADGAAVDDHGRFMVSPEAQISWLSRHAAIGKPQLHDGRIQSPSRTTP